MIRPLPLVDVNVDRFGNPETPRRTIKMSGRKALKKLLRQIPSIVQSLSEQQFADLCRVSLKIDEFLGRVREHVSDLVGDLLGYFLIEEASALSKRTRVWPRLTPSSKPKLPPTGL